MLAAILLVLVLPLFALLGAGVRALFLFWPTMLALGAVHSYVDWVPALGWQATFWVVFALSLLVPTGSNLKTD